MDRDLSRRAALAGLCGALALAFAPLEAFFARLGELVAGIPGRDEGWDAWTMPSDYWAEWAQHTERIMLRMYESVGLVYG